jgi:hypothetical protein
MQKRVVIQIQPDGTTSVDAQGFKGKGCAEATDQIAIALGGDFRDKSDDKKKPDYFATNPGMNTGKI